LYVWSLLPCAYLINTDEQALHFDAGERMLRFYDRICRNAPGRKPFPLEIAWSEPLLVDINRNWKYDADDGDEFDDLNGNLKWDAYPQEPLTLDNNNDGLYDPDAEDQFQDLNENERWDRCFLLRYREGDKRIAEPLDEIAGAKKKSEEE